MILLDKSRLWKTIHCVICMLDLVFMYLTESDQYLPNMHYGSPASHYQTLFCSLSVVFFQAYFSPSGGPLYSVTDLIYTCPIHWPYSGMMVLQLTCPDRGSLFSPGRDFRHPPDLPRQLVHPSQPPNRPLSLSPRGGTCSMPFYRPETFILIRAS